MEKAGWTVLVVIVRGKAQARQLVCANDKDQGAGFRLPFKG